MSDLPNLPKAEIEVDKLQKQIEEIDFYNATSQKHIPNVSNLLEKRGQQEAVKFWANDPAVLFTPSELVHIIPLQYMTFEARLNALMRGSIILSVVLMFYIRSSMAFMLPVTVAILTYLIYSWTKNTEATRERVEDFKVNIGGYDYNVVYPTRDNPMMNQLLTDYNYNPTRIAASELNTLPNPRLKDAMDKAWYFNLYRDIDDVWEKANGQRQFYTTPSTTIPNEQGKFAMWLYGYPKTCKEGNGAECVHNVYDWLNGSAWRNGVWTDMVW